MSKGKKIVSILKGVLIGAVKAVPILGNVATELEANKRETSDHAPTGQVDYPRIIGYVIMAMIVVSVIAGWLTIEDAKTLIKQLDIFSLVG